MPPRCMREGPRRPRADREGARGRSRLWSARSPRTSPSPAGATEANMLALTPAIESRRRGRATALFVSAVEHPSVLQRRAFCGRSRRAIAGRRRRHRRSRQRSRARSAEAERPLVSVMLANNETGVVQPIAEVADIVHAAGGLLHVDAVQAPGRIACDIDDARRRPADDFLAQARRPAGRRRAGPRAAICIAEPLIRGGGQERGLRAGTENVAAIAGFGAAAAPPRPAGRWPAAWRRCATGSRPGSCAATPDAVIFGATAPRLPNTTLVRGSRHEGGNRA